MSCTAVYRFMGREFETKLEIGRYVPPCEVSFQVPDGPFASETLYSLREDAEHRTCVQLDLFVDPKDFFGFIPKPLLWPIFQKSAKDDCRRQKEIMENGARE